MNTPGERDGNIISWFDGKLALSCIGAFRAKGATFGIDNLNFTTFFGGNTPDWAPTKDEVIYFNDFKIYTEETNDNVGKVVIENPKGSYKSFEVEDDPVWKDYPLAGVTYPVDYGYMEGYKSEDNHDLDVFIGTGDLNGYMKIWRYDVPLETKFMLDISQEEWNEIINIYSPVIKEKKLFKNEEEFRSTLNTYKR
jgi:hypothetical protein